MKRPGLTETGEHKRWCGSAAAGAGAGAVAVGGPLNYYSFSKYNPPPARGGGPSWSTVGSQVLALPLSFCTIVELCRLKAVAPAFQQASEECIGQQVDTVVPPTATHLHPLAPTRVQVGLSPEWATHCGRRCLPSHPPHPPQTTLHLSYLAKLPESGTEGVTDSAVRSILKGANPHAVERIELTGCLHARGTGWLNSMVLARFVNLRSLELVGCSKVGRSVGR